MAVHVLKVWPEPYWALHAGQKTAEFRKDDRGFAVGDVLMLQPWSPREFQPGVPQGHLNWPALRAEVGHVARGPHVPEGYAMLSLKGVREATVEEDDAAMREPGAYGKKERGAPCPHGSRPAACLVDGCQGQSKLDESARGPNA